MKKSFITLFCVIYSLAAVAAGVITCPAYDANYMPAKITLPSEELLSKAKAPLEPLSAEEIQIRLNTPEFHAFSYDFWLNEVSDWAFLKDKSKDKTISSEYVLMGDVSFVGTTAINIEIYSDGTGSMIYEFHDCGKDRIILSRTIALNRSQTKEIERIIEDNNFWKSEINTSQGLDGNTIMVEGVKHNKYNFLYKWSPLPDDAEYRIYYSIKECYNKWK